MDEISSVYDVIVKRYLVEYYNEIADLIHADLPDGTRQDAMREIDERYAANILKDLGINVFD